jgi:hypothetical protein
MKPGDLVRIVNMDDGTYNRVTVQEHGYLWVAVRPVDFDLWGFSSIATGYEQNFYEWRFERVEDAEEG